MLDFDTGKYAAYVWPSFAVSALFLGAMIADSLGRAHRWKREVDKLLGKKAEDESCPGWGMF